MPVTKPEPVTVPITVHLPQPITGPFSITIPITVPSVPFPIRVAVTVYPAEPYPAASTPDADDDSAAAIRFHAAD